MKIQFCVVLPNYMVFTILCKVTPQHPIVGLLNSARDRVRPSFVDFVFWTLRPSGGGSCCWTPPNNDNDNTGKFWGRYFVQKSLTFDDVQGFP